jgi:hypothetical protein
MSFQLKPARQLYQVQGFDFPDYQFVEYPKHVKSVNEFDAKGVPLVVTVNSKEEELAATTKSEPLPPTKPTPVFTAPKS